MKNKYRLKFSKLDKMAYIGHLDLLKIFQRSIKRANLPIAYSQGFNPHQIMSFALPLSLGMESMAEYLDFELTKAVSPDFIIESLNSATPKNLQILACRKLLDTEKNSASIVNKASYLIKFNFNLNLNSIIEEILSKEEILVEKKSKSKTKDINIRKDIFEIEKITETSMKILVSAGSLSNLNPNLICKYILSQNNLEKYSPFDVSYTRLELYMTKDDIHCSLI